MRVGVFTIFILLAGILSPAYKAHAVVIKSTDKLKSNYEIHHKIIIYNNLSSYQSTNKKPFKNKQDLISRQYSTDNFFDGYDTESKTLQEIGSTKLTQFPINISNLNNTYAYTSKTRADLFFKNGQEGNYPETLVGSFLDSFKNEPLLQTIYFSSKDLTFSYRKKIADILQLGFDMEANDYKKFEGSWRDGQEDMGKPLTAKETQNLKQEAKALFGLISESYKTIFYVILTIFGAIYISFRYILNKYI